LNYRVENIWKITNISRIFNVLYGEKQDFIALKHSNFAEFEAENKTKKPK